MGRRDERHSGRPRWRVLPAVLVLLLLASAVAADELEAGPRWLGWDWSGPVDQPAAVDPPPGLDLPALRPAPVVLAGSPLGGAPVPDLDEAAIAQVVAPYLDRDDLGRRLTVAVAALGSAEPAYVTGAERVTPASTTKLLTATAVLSALGPDHTFRTTVRGVPGTPRIVLVGGGDPFLAREQSEADAPPAYPARADLRTLATATASALRAAGRTRVRLDYDATLFTGDRVNPAWPASYGPDDVVAPISALWVDGGRPDEGDGRVDDPPRVAAEEFADALRAVGIRVAPRVRERAAPAEATELAEVSSAPLEQIVERALDVSDNETTEVLGHHVALARNTEATFEGAAAAVVATLGELGVDASGDTLRDSSGLSRENLISPETLLGVLAVAAERPELRAVLGGLPVAGFTGSLALRFDTGDPAGLGQVRAKTGTLTGVHGLAGVVTEAGGTPLAFVVLADRVRAPGGIGSGGIEQAVARQRIDELAADLAACRCSG